MRSFFRSLWTRSILRGIHYRDRHDRFEQLYRIEDPWHMNAESEKFRFEETNHLIRDHFRNLDSMLEVGCGEGHQTAKLADLCSKLYAIDISGRAIERARRRCPRVNFDVGDIFSAPILESLPRVDLVVACEVLYYMSDVPAVLARMQQLGNSCLVTYVGDEHAGLSAPLARIPNQQSTKFSHNQVSWHAVWWPSQPRLASS
jgi:predicted TPR repeat methyltransferase